MSLAATAVAFAAKLVGLISRRVRTVSSIVAILFAIMALDIPEMEVSYIKR